MFIGAITDNKDYEQKENGNVRLRMQIQFNIPSSMTVENDRIEIYYR